MISIAGTFMVKREKWLIQVSLWQTHKCTIKYSCACTCVCIHAHTQFKMMNILNKLGIENISKSLSSSQILPYWMKNYDNVSCKGWNKQGCALFFFFYFFNTLLKFLAIAIKPKKEMKPRNWKGSYRFIFLNNYKFYLWKNKTKVYVQLT